MSLGRLEYPKTARRLVRPSESGTAATSTMRRRYSTLTRE
jgi:hypothetical protein